MSHTDKQVLLQWLEKAEHDLITAALIIESNPIILDIACFHCQQTIEKFLKTFILFAGKEISKTHNLNLLLKHCSDIDVEFLLIDVKGLDHFAVRVRYPHQYIIPELDEVQYCYQVALQVKAIVVKKINLV